MGERGGGGGEGGREGGGREGGGEREGERGGGGEKWGEREGEKRKRDRRVGMRERLITNIIQETKITDTIIKRIVSTGRSIHCTCIVHVGVVTDSMSKGL